MRSHTSDATCAAGGAVVSLLAMRHSVEPIAAAITERVVPRAAYWFTPYYGFLVAGVCSLAGAGLGLLLLWACTRWGRPWVAPVLVVAAGVIVGGLAAPWLVYAAPIAIASLTPLLMTGEVAPRCSPHEPLVCVAIEGACLGVGLWFPVAQTFPAFMTVVMGAGATSAMLAAASLRPHTRWRLATAGLPLLLLPLEGLRRNPTSLAVVCALAAATILWAVARDGRINAWARNNAIVAALVALGSVFFLPWAFRDLFSADVGGHEGQHLGWINSMSFGKLMMADAGFTYGPIREYALAVIAWAAGGITLDHVRLAHVVVNLTGCTLIVFAMHRVAGKQVLVPFVGLLLAVTHSPLVSYVVYWASFAFGWGDVLRPALATLAVVVTLGSRRLVWGGVLIGLAALYSHDFGVPALAAVLGGLGLEFLARRVRFRELLRSLRAFGIGIAIAIVPLLAYYAVNGKLGAFFGGYAWTVRVFAGLPWGGTPHIVTFESVSSWHALVAPSRLENNDGLLALEDFVCPALVIAGFVHGLVAIVRRRLDRRAIVIIALSLFVAMALRHAFMLEDAEHMLSAQAPALVLFVAMAAGASKLRFGTVAVMILPAIWLATAATPINARLSRIASGKERPSTGAPYHYADIPRAGDELVTDAHLVPVRWVRAHTKPTDPVYVTTGSINGGTEAFLTERRNPTSFDKSDEVVTEALRRRALEQLTHDPPALILGEDFGLLGEDTGHFIEKNYHSEYIGSVKIWTRN